jgi:hypothetical protein
MSCVEYRVIYNILSFLSFDLTIQPLQPYQGKFMPQPSCPLIAKKNEEYSKTNIKKNPLFVLLDFAGTCVYVVLFYIL